MKKKKEYLYKFLTEYTVDGQLTGDYIWAKDWKEAEHILKQKSATEKIVGQAVKEKGRGFIKFTEEELYGL